MNDMNRKTPYALNSPVLRPVRRCPMDVTYMLKGYNFFKYHIPLSKTYDQHRNLVTLCVNWLDGIERTNDIEERLKVLDDIRYFFKGRLKERRRFLSICNAITAELNEIALEKVQEFVDEDGNVIETKASSMGFHTSNRKAGF